MEVSGHKQFTGAAPGANTDREKVKPLWPVWGALLSVLRPGLAASRTQHASLLQVWFAFMLSLVVGVCVIVLVTAGFNIREVSIQAFWMQLGLIVFEVIDEFSRDPSMVILTVLAVGTGVHLVSFVLATILMPMGARDEPLRASFYYSLRLVWLSVLRLALIVLVLGSVGGVLDRVERNWSSINPRPVWPIRPVRPNNADFPNDEAAYAEAVTEYERATVQYDKDKQRYREEQRAWSDKKPWFVQNWEALIVLSSVSASLWHCCMFGAALGIRRRGSHDPRPPTCEFCGYNLTMTPVDSRCPECGTLVLASLGPDVRMGPPWEHRLGLGRHTAFWQTAKAAILTPTALGRTLQVGANYFACRRFVLVCLPGFFAIATLTMTLTLFSQVSYGEIESELHVIMPMITVFGIACAIGACVVGQLAASLVGLVCSAQQKRNLMPAAHQSACYLFSFLLVWEVVGALLGISLTELATAGSLSWLETTTPISEQAWIAILWIVPNIGMAVTFLVLVARATNAARYANN